MMTEPSLVAGDEDRGGGSCRLRPGLGNSPGDSDEVYGGLWGLRQGSEIAQEAAARPVEAA